MKNEITNIQELQVEKERLTRLLEVQKAAIREDFELLRHQLEPAGKLINTVGNITGNGVARPLLKMGLGAGLDWLLGRTLFKKAGLVTGVAIPFLLRNATNGTITNKIRNVFSTVGRFFSGKKKTGAAL
ncbi:hypothetical protein [Flavihumibacter petaseus]|uniref:Uncharacterized protein n=1 Tax=Flavihumibacter petaseus NBRC 106054 TaxID=1220578 RepID=A0A0E9MYD0_9BACT|nr:hypothetical protein [Flavihumibacter petaseus]GAO42416.1 hypothetical protein FPE01S_01_14310 [Flavihumibacter petaseus NBRC 106054]